MECLQDMTVRRLKNLKVRAETDCLLGSDNSDLINAIDTELSRRKKFV